MVFFEDPADETAIALKAMSPFFTEYHLKYSTINIHLDSHNEFIKISLVNKHAMRIAIVCPEVCDCEQNVVRVEEKNELLSIEGRTMISM